MGTQRVIQGTVVSDKMQKTVVVSVERKKKHRLYHKVMSLTKRYSRLQVTEFGTTVIAHPIITVGQNLLFRQQTGDTIGQLNLAARTGLDVFQVVKNAARQNVTTHHCQG